MKERPKIYYKLLSGMIQGFRRGEYSINSYAAGALFGLYKIMQRKLKLTENLAHLYSSESTQRELSNEYEV